MMAILTNYRIHSALRLPSSSGFTLLEVMIAVAILAITLTVLFGSQSQSLSLAAEAKFNTHATFLMQEKLAELESKQLELYNDEGDFGEAYPGFRWKIEIDDLYLTEPEILADMERPFQQVTLTILWGNGPYSHTIAYYLQESSE